MNSKILVDSHVLLWLLKEPHRIGPGARRLLNEAQIVYVSAATIWELTIKSQSGKLQPLPRPLRQSAIDMGMLELDITCKHAAFVTDVMTPHADLFDRLLLAQARAENLILLTADGKLLPDHQTFNARS